MLFMIIVKASKNSEDENKANPELMKQMDDYNEALEAAGVRVMAKGLHPTKEAIRYAYLSPDKKPVKSYGPFEPVQDQVAGFFLIEVNSKEEAIYWAEKVPDPHGYGDSII